MRPPLNPFLSRNYKRRTYQLILILGLIIICSCGKEKLNTYYLKGVAQKGPFLMGTPVNIYELDEDMDQTGKAFYTTITDNTGSFSLPDFEFASNFVLLVADGQYYNEVVDFESSDRLTLMAIADLNESSTVNINVVTHLELERLKYLVKKDSLSFKEAKKQCLKEIFQIFSMTGPETIKSEHLDISKTGDENNKLLAISSIIQSNYRITKLTALLSGIQLDLKENGILDSEALQSDLITYAQLLDCKKVVANMLTRYAALGIEIEKPDIRPYVGTFAANSNYIKLVEIDFPQNTDFGINLLSLGDTVVIDTSQDYCMAINQVSKISLLVTEIIFYQEEEVINRENIEISHLVNWSYGIEHPFGSKIGMAFGTENLTGEAKLKIAFRSHGEFKISTRIWADEYGWSERDQLLQW